MNDKENEINMKSKIISITLIVFLFTNSWVQAQNSDNAKENMIKDFYTKYCKIWNRTSISVPANILHGKLDSLAQYYCTTEIRNKAKSWFEDGHDLFTNDWGINLESLKSLSITKDLTKPSTYHVSYVVETFPVSPNEAVKKQITLHVSMKKQQDIYKINEIK